MYPALATITGLQLTPAHPIPVLDLHTIFTALAQFLA
jgi:hypothetical protein